MRQIGQCHIQKHSCLKKEDSHALHRHETVRGISANELCSSKQAKRQPLAPESSVTKFVRANVTTEGKLDKEIDQASGEKGHPL